MIHLVLLTFAGHRRECFISTHQVEPRRRRRRCGSCTYRGDSTAVATSRRRLRNRKPTRVARMRRSPLPPATRRSRASSGPWRHPTSVANSIRRRASSTCTCSRSTRSPPHYSSTVSPCLHDNTDGSMQQRSTSHSTQNGWLGSRVVSALDSGTEGPRFKSQSRRCRVTVLELFTPTVPLFTKQQNW